MLDKFDFTAEDIKSAIKPNNSDVVYLIQFHKVALILNLVLAVGFVGIYFFINNTELLFPLTIILCSYVFLVSGIIELLISGRKIPSDLPVLDFLKRHLQLIKKMERRNTSTGPLIFTINFIAGFISGLILNERTFFEVITHPIFMPILVVLSVSFYFIMRKYLCQLPKDRFAIEYQRRKSNIEKTILQLEAND